MSCSINCQMCNPISWTASNPVPPPEPTFSDTAKWLKLPERCLGRELVAIMQIMDPTDPLATKFKGFYRKSK